MLVENSLVAFSESLAAKTPTPGGGSAGAYAGSMAAALGLMTLRFSKVQGSEGDLESIRKRFLELVDEDAGAYTAFDEALKLPKASPERSAAMAKAIRHATQVPLQGMELALKGLAAIRSFAAESNKNLASDLIASALFFQTAARVLKQNVVINTKGGKNPELAARATEVERAVDALAGETVKLLESAYAPK